MFFCNLKSKMKAPKMYVLGMLLLGTQIALGARELLENADPGAREVVPGMQQNASVDAQAREIGEPNVVYKNGDNTSSDSESDESGMQATQTVDVDEKNSSDEVDADAYTDGDSPEADPEGEEDIEFPARETHPDAWVSDKFHECELILPEQVWDEDQMREKSDKELHEHHNAILKRYNEAEDADNKMFHCNSDSKLAVRDARQKGKDAKKAVSAAKKAERAIKVAKSAWDQANALMIGGRPEMAEDVATKRQAFTAAQRIFQTKTLEARRAEEDARQAEEIARHAMTPCFGKVGGDQLLFEYKDFAVRKHKAQEDFEMWRRILNEFEARLDQIKKDRV